MSDNGVSGIGFDFRVTLEASLDEVTRVMEAAEAQGFDVKVKATGAEHAKLTVKAAGQGWVSAVEAADAIKTVVKKG